TKVFWGEAVIEKPLEEKKTEDGVFVFFKLKSIKKWLYKLSTSEIQPKLDNQNQRLRIVGISKEEYLLIKEEMEKNNVLSEKRQDELINLWNSYKSSSKEDLNQVEAEYQSIITDFNFYKNKIEDGSFGLDDYTNVLSNTGSNQGGYLCNFLERTTRRVFGSSKPGNAINFEVKLNKDGHTYTIKQHLQRGEKEGNLDKE